MACDNNRYSLMTHNTLNTPMVLIKHIHLDFKPQTWLCNLVSKMACLLYILVAHTQTFIEGTHNTNSEVLSFPYVHNTNNFTRSSLWLKCLLISDTYLPSFGSSNMITETILLTAGIITAPATSSTGLSVSNRYS